MKTVHRIKGNIEPLGLIFSALGGVVLLFIVAPLAGMALRTSPEELIQTGAQREVLESIWMSLWTSMAATLLFALASIPFAYLLARKTFPGKRLVNAIVDLPIVIPHSAAGIAILGFISRDSLLGRAAQRVGIEFIGGAPGIMLAMAFVSLPFLINAARDGFCAVPERLEKAARNLGASPARVFFTISLPLAWRAILSGLIMMWARGLSEFGAVVVVAYHPMTAAVLIYERFGAFGLKYARPISVILIGVCLLFFVAVRLLARERSHAPR
ncbi:MAG TPA: ABC transporter permease [Candidatus Hydrogenedentes bacterium]|nr:ABC transporter permease [Candidatus Hydrogenedentota bacterium]